MPHGFSTSISFSSFASRHQTQPQHDAFDTVDLSPQLKRPPLTRPPSSKGRFRPGTANSGARPPDPFAPLLPSRAPGSTRENTLNVAVDSAQISFTPPAGADKPVWDEETKQWMQADQAFTSQRATLRHVHSVAHLPPVPAPKLPPIPMPDIKQDEVDVPQWMTGKAELQIHGRGGDSGAELKVYIGTQPHPTIKHFIPPRTHTDATDYFNPTGVTQFLEITDVQLVHHSVFSRHHILSVRVPSTSILSPIAKIPTFDLEAREAHSKPAKSGTGIGGFFGFTKPKPVSPATPTRLDRAIPATPGLSPDTLSSGTSSMHTADDVYDQVIFLCFNSDQDRGDWFSLLRSFCRCPDNGFRLHRRLEIRVYDLHESRQALLSLQDDASSTHRQDEKARNQLKPGWPEREKICGEVLTDDIVLGRTTWQKAEEGKRMPFWGETLQSEELPDFAFCMLRLYRMVKTQPVIFATVELPLTSNFARGEDERYPVHSTDSGAIIGELRMTVLFHEVAVQPKKKYAISGLFAEESGVRLLYYLSARGQLEGTPDLFARIGLADGSNLPRLLAMCRLESQASAETLFRSNTPLSKLLEACLRLRCGTFLRHSLGPTVQRVFGGCRSRSRIPDDGNKLSYDSLRIMLDLAKTCWSNMYMQRGHFQNFLRHVFAKLFQSVKDSHPLPGEEKLRYKALSSFLFLRLIGPALMRPHLFGLCDGLPSASAQRTLTLLAKILNALAFFTPRDMQRDEELGMFSKFINENSEAMVDYLASFATPLDQFQSLPPPPTPICSFVTERCKIIAIEQAEIVPQLTTAGPIDYAADLAILSEILYDRRSDTPTYPLTFLEDEALAEKSADKLDVVLKKVHKRAIELAGSEAADSENRILRATFSFDSTFPFMAHTPTSPSLTESTRRRRGSPSVWKWASFSLLPSSSQSTPGSGQSRKQRPFSPSQAPLPIGSVKQVIRLPEIDG